MEKIQKIFNAVIKSVDHADHTVEVVVSTGAVDRHMESVLPEAFKKRLSTYKAHPVLLSSHDYYDLRKQIGEATSVKVKDDALIAKFKYYVGEGNQEADWAFNLASKKVAAYSIGFIPHGYNDNQENYADAKKNGNPMRTYTDVELIEISQVLIPSNRDAVQERSQLKNDAEHKDEDFAVAELCTKALADKELIPDVVKQIKVEEKKEEAKISKEDVEAMISARFNQAVIVKEVFDLCMKDESARRALVQELFSKMKSDEEFKKEFKSMILDAVQDIAEDEFFRELIFGKVAPKGPQPTQSLSDEIKRIARTN